MKFIEKKIKMIMIIKDKKDFLKIEPWFQVLKFEFKI